MQKIQKKLSSRAILAIVLAGVLTFLVVGYAIISGIELPDDTDTDTTSYITPIDGETADNRIYEKSNYDSIYAYGNVHIKVKDGEYSLTKTGVNADFVLSYRNEEGDMVVYAPPIIDEDSSFSYSDLYSTLAYGEADVPTIYYLLSSVGNIAFSARIALKEDLTERDNQLRIYGFDSTKAVGEDSDYSFEYAYFDQSGNLFRHMVSIGKCTISSGGYYIRVGDYNTTAKAYEYRPYVYVTSNRAIEYAMQPFSYYINPILVAKGLSSDGILEPFYVSDFKEYVNTTVSDVGTPVDTSAILSVEASYFSSESGSAERGAKNKYAFDLAKYKDKADYQRLISQLSAATLGELSSPLSFTQIIGVSNDKLLDITQETPTVNYRYEILSVDGLIYTDREVTTPGTTVGTCDLVRVTYRYSVYTQEEGVWSWKVQGDLHYAIIDLSDASITAADEIRQMKVGETPADAVTFDIAYTAANADTHMKQWVVKDILGIYDASFAKSDDITATSYVYVNVDVKVDGEITKTMFGLIDMKSKILYVDDENEVSLTEESNLIGVHQEAHPNTVIASEEEYTECFYDYVNYEISALNYFVKENLVAGFKFVNDTERDAFYGESIYKNTLPSTDPHSLYGIDNNNCYNLTKTLGGLGSDSTASVGLTGTKTVAVGLTASVMDKYGLYAYTVYYELPRGIDNVDDSEDNTNIFSYSKLGFKMHVSERNPDGTRYVGCELYDTVVLIDGDVFDFLDYSFTEYWARKAIVITDITNVTNIKLKLNTEEVYGEFDFSLTHKEIENSEDSSDTYTHTTVDVTPKDCGSATSLRNYLTAKSTTTVGLDDFYADVGGFYKIESGKKIKTTIGKNFAGSAYFTSVIQTLYLTNYLGEVPADEQAKALLTSPEMTLVFKLNEDIRYFTFEFYRISDRQVMVRVYIANKNGENLTAAVSDFYITSTAFKKIVNEWNNVLSAEAVDSDATYGD